MLRYRFCFLCVKFLAMAKVPLQDFLDCAGYAALRSRFRAEPAVSGKLSDELTDKRAAGANIGYARVSTADQEPALQLDALAKVDCVEIFQDKASGSRPTDPAWRALCRLFALATLWSSGSWIGSGGRCRT
jgi:hypothetical protein